MALQEGSISQTAYVVHDVEKTAARWTALTGAGPWYLLEPETTNTIYRGAPSECRYRIALSFCGTEMLELIMPMNDEPSIFTEVLNERGEGFHHIAPRIMALQGPTFDARLAELESLGLSAAMTNDIAGLGRCAFYDAKDSLGGFIEVFEVGGMFNLLPMMADIHAGWDGKEPIRQMESLFGSL